jgi:hypothetical protein
VLDEKKNILRLFAADPLSRDFPLQLERRGVGEEAEVADGEVRGRGRGDSRKQRAESRNSS